MNFIGAGLAIIGAAIGAGYGNGQVIAKTIESMARQPEMSGQLRSDSRGSYRAVISLPIRQARKGRNEQLHSFLLFSNETMTFRKEESLC